MAFIVRNAIVFFIVYSGSAMSMIVYDDARGLGMSKKRAYRRSLYFVVVTAVMYTTFLLTTSN